MKKYHKIVQVGKIGQLVIPKDIRDELDVDETTGFYVYSIEDEGILLKKIQPHELSEDDPVVKEIKEKADKLDIDPENLKKAIEDYKKKKDGNLELI